MNKSLSQLNRRKSLRRNSVLEKARAKKNSLGPIAAPKIREEIENSLCSLYQRVNSVKELTTK